MASARLSRLTANVADGDLDHMAAGGEKVLVEDWCQQFPIHINGTVAFGSDGKLYASHGSAASAHFTDYGQTGVPPRTRAATRRCPPVARRRSRPRKVARCDRRIRRRPNDPYTLDGTVIRVDPDTGDGVAGNPLFSSTDANARRIVVYGLRMPFRFAPRPNANELWIGDVGENLYEEVDRVPIGGPLVNGGWPCYEAGERQPRLPAAEHLQEPRGAGSERGAAAVLAVHPPPARVHRATRARTAGRRRRASRSTAAARTRRATTARCSWPTTRGSASS